MVSTAEKERKKEDVLTININNQHQHNQHSKEVNNLEQGKSCAVCKKIGPTQTHHLSYEPKIIIDVCVPCHMKIHQHGVGVASGAQKTLDKIIEEKPELLMPLYTKLVQIDESNFTVSMKDDKVLDCLVCPNCQHGSTWAIYGHPNTRELFLRCFECGFDAKINRIYREDQNE